MKIINTLLGLPLGYLMYLCLLLVRNYGAAIILFTLLTKLLMFPLSLSSQKNALIMAKIQPALDDVKQRNRGKSTLMIEEQRALFKAEGYSTLKSLLPLLAQIPLILGLINVIYHPLQHLLHLDAAAISSLLDRTADLLGTTAARLGTGGQLKVMETVQASPRLFAGMEGVGSILDLDTWFLGTQLTHLPAFGSITLIYPALSGLSALALAAYQNKHYILQLTQGPVRKWLTAAFLVAFSVFFAAILPAGIGLYWITGNLLSIPVLAACNRIHDPRPYLDRLQRASKVRLSRQERAAARALARGKRRRQKMDKKRFAACPGKQLVFYSEGSGFYKYFQGFMDFVLDHSDLSIHYVTSDFHDRIFQNTHPRIQSYYIGPIALIQFMMKMDADMVVMTTPDLETYHIKRSLVRKDVEYIFIDHGMASYHLMYRKGALDHFDTIFCYGPSNIREVRETEKLYGLPPKNLVKTGFPLLDSMLREVEALGEIRNQPRIILIAPSWQKDNILESCLEETLKPLLATGYRIVVRPHPEFVKRFPAKIRAIQDRYAGLPDDRLEIQTDFSSSETVYTADLVITDWSSIAQEFSYATKKPSLFINTPMKILNPEYDRIPIVPLDISLRDQIGLSVDPDQLDRLPQMIERLFREKDRYAQRISEIVSRNIFDLGDGARGGGSYMIRKLEMKQEEEKSPPAHQQPDIGQEQGRDTGALENQIMRLDRLRQEGRLGDPRLEEILKQPLSDRDPALKTRGDLLLQIMEDLESAARDGEEGQA